MMGFKINRSTRRSGNLGAADTGGSQHGTDPQAKSGSKSNAPQAQLRRSHKLSAIILSVLDRDSELRHDYLLRRWQGFNS